MEKSKRSNDFSRFDPYLMICVLSALIIGFLVIASSTRSLGQTRFLIAQGGAVVLGIVAIIFILKIDYDYIGQLAPYIFVLNILLLIVVLFIGQGDEVGTKGWIRFGSFGVQPSELVKVGFIITFAKHIESVHDDLNNPKNILLLLAHGGVIIGLVLLQPDLGTAMVFATIIIGMLFVADIGLRYVFSALGAVGIFAPIAWFFLLKPYQRDRFLAFLQPEKDPLNTGYHVMQSKIAIGSGKVVGRGLFNGVQTQLGFLPEKQTDFIYAVVGEELGFWGSALVLFLLITIIIRCFYIGRNSRDVLGELICVGVGSMFLFHVVENIGMCIGLMPVTGIPLPFVSYGGSNLLTSLLAIGIVMNVRLRRKRINF